MSRPSPRPAIPALRFELFCLFVAAGTPKPIIDKIAADATRIVRSPEISARLIADGWEPGGGTPEEFRSIWVKLSEQFGKVIQQRHITSNRMP